MKSLPLLATLFAAASLLTIPLGAADAPAAKQIEAKKQFVAKFTLSATDDGKARVVAEPQLITNEGEEGSFFTGGEVPVEGAGKGNAFEFVPFGLQTKIKVRELAADELRVSVYAGHSELDDQQKNAGKGAVVVRETGVRCVRSVKPGERFEIEIDAGRKVSVSVERVKAKEL